MEELDKLLKDIRKEFEDDYIVLTSNDMGDTKIIPVSTGSLSLDIASGIGGIPLGRVTEIYGVESSGKTTLCQHVVANAQKKGYTCVYVDTEQAIDPDYLEICGVDLEKLIISQPDNLDTALSVTERFIDSGQVQLIIFDSAVGLSTSKEKEKEMGERSVSSISGLLTQFFKKNMYGIRTNGTGVIFTNQARDVIGSYVPMIGTSGGHALKHYSSLRIQTRKGKEIKAGDEIIGNTCDAVFKKNKVGGFPGKVASFEIYYNRGIVRAAELFQSALDYGIIAQRGAYVFYNQENLAQGKQNCINLFETNAELAEKIERETLEIALVKRE